MFLSDPAPRCDRGSCCCSPSLGCSDCGRTSEAPEKAGAVDDDGVSAGNGGAIGSSDEELWASMAGQLSEDDETDVEAADAVIGGLSVEAADPGGRSGKPFAIKLCSVTVLGRVVSGIKLGVAVRGTCLASETQLGAVVTCLASGVGLDFGLSSGRLDLGLSS